MKGIQTYNILRYLRSGTVFLLTNPQSVIMNSVSVWEEARDKIATFDVLFPCESRGPAGGQMGWPADQVRHRVAESVLSVPTLAIRTSNCKQIPTYCIIGLWYLFVPFLEGILVRKGKGIRDTIELWSKSIARSNSSINIKVEFTDQQLRGPFPSNPLPPQCTFTNDLSSSSFNSSVSFLNSFRTRNESSLMAAITSHGNRMVPVTWCHFRRIWSL